MAFKYQCNMAGKVRREGGKLRNTGKWVDVIILFENINIM